VMPKTGKRFRANVMAVISNKGELYFTRYRGSFNGPVFLAYLKRLVRQVDRKIHLIADRASGASSGSLCGTGWRKRLPALRCTLCPGMHLS
jgi:hypothetical protein